MKQQCRLQKNLDGLGSCVNACVCVHPYLYVSANLNTCTFTHKPHIGGHSQIHVITYCRHDCSRLCVGTRACVSVNMCVCMCVLSILYVFPRACHGGNGIYELFFRLRMCKCMKEGVFCTKYNQNWSWERVKKTTCASTSRFCVLFGCIASMPTCMHKRVLHWLHHWQ